MQKKNIWKKVTTSKIPKIEAKKLYKELIEKDIDALTREKSNSFKRHNIFWILDNVAAIFTASTHWNYRELPKETMFERTIAESLKLRKAKIAEIEGEEKKHKQ